MAAAALVAAQQFVDGSQEQEAKRPRIFAPGSAPSAAGSQDGVLLTQLLRAHLVQTNAVLDATNSTQLVLLVKDEEDKKYLLGLLNAWHQKQREVALTPEQRRAGQQQKPHEFGPRKTFLYHAVLDRVKQVAPPACKEALESLLQVEDATVDLSLANFGPEYNTPKEGRVWKWKVSMTSCALDSFRQHWLILAQHLTRTGAIPWILEPSRQYQSQLTKDLWQALKERAPGPTG